MCWTFGCRMARFAFYRRGDFTGSREKVNKEKVGFVTLPCTRSLRRSDADIKLLYVLSRGRPSISVAHMGPSVSLELFNGRLLPIPIVANLFGIKKQGGISISDSCLLLLLLLHPCSTIRHHSTLCSHVPGPPRALSGLLLSPSPITILD